MMLAHIPQQAVVVVLVPTAYAAWVEEGPATWELRKYMGRRDSVNELNLGTDDNDDDDDDGRDIGATEKFSPSTAVVPYDNNGENG